MRAPYQLGGKASVQRGHGVAWGHMMHVLQAEAQAVVDQVELAAGMLLSLMRGEQPPTHRIDVGFELVLRDST